MSRQCPFTDCGELIPSDKFGCRRHWFSLSKDQQERIWTCYRAWQRGAIGPGELLAEQRAVIDEAEGRP